MLFETPALGERELEVIAEITKLKDQLGYMVNSSPKRWTGLLRRNALARAVRGSNSIEGYNVNYNDAIAAVDGEEPVDAKDREWANIFGYRQAMTYALQLTGEANLQIEESTIRAMHFMMLSHDMKAHPGIWRRGGIFVRREPDDVIVYEGPDPELVPGLINELVESLLSMHPDLTKTEAIETAVRAYLANTAHALLRRVAGTVDIEDLSGELRKADRST